MLPHLPLLPPPHCPLPATCRCQHRHSPPLLDLQSAFMPAAISTTAATAVEPPSLALPQLMGTHLLLLPALPSSTTCFFCCRCRRCCHLLTSCLYCIPVRNAYQYASIWLCSCYSLQRISMLELVTQCKSNFQTAYWYPYLLHTGTQCVLVLQHITVHVISYHIPVRWTSWTKWQSHFQIAY